MSTIEELYRIFNKYRSISTDTRKLIPGSVFFALKGENFDGNKFASEALEKGCLYAVVDDPSLPVNDKIIYFPDVLTTLQELATYHRKQLKIPVIGITGSNGKTTTKELIAAILGRKFKVCSTQGNLNNHIGVPLTILTITNHEFAIVEMGANHTGEIAALCRIADPDYGIITNIGKAHLEGFGSPQAVVKAKSELYTHLADRKGTCFADAENSLLQRLVNERELNTVLYGNGRHSVCTGKITDNSNFLSVRIHMSGYSKDLRIQSMLVGDYNLNNMLAAVCIGNFFGVQPVEIESALSAYKPSNSRSQLMQTKKNRIVLDAYNANPVSMESSILNFLSLKDDLPKMMILGDMLELGTYSRSEHSAIVSLLKRKLFMNVIFVGPEFCSVSESSSCPCFKNVEGLIEHFRLNPVLNHSILLKGSRGIKLEKLLEVL